MHFFYIPINKCGNTSLRTVFSRVNKIHVPTNNNNLQSLLSSKSHMEKFKRFTVVRHPYDRVLSLWNSIHTQKSLKYCRKAKTVEELMGVITSDVPFKNEWSKYYKRYIKRHSLPITHPHYGICKEGEDKLYLDDWFYLQDLQPMKDYLSIDIEIPKKNQSSGKKPEGWEELCHDRLFEYYRKDIETFYQK